MSKPDEPFWDVALGEVKNVDERLWFELSGRQGKVREFIVTAEGQVDAFPAAETLISLAPRIRGWSFIALKPAMGFDFNTRYEGTLFEPERMWFLPLAIANQPQSLAF